MHKFTGLHITFLKEILWTNCPKMPACELGIRDNFPIFWPNPKVGKTITDKAESENYPALIGTTNIELMEKFSWHSQAFTCLVRLSCLSCPLWDGWEQSCPSCPCQSLAKSCRCFGQLVVPWIYQTTWTMSITDSVIPSFFYHVSTDFKTSKVRSHLFFMEVKLRMPDWSLRTLHSNPNRKKTVYVHVVDALHLPGIPAV